MKSLQSDVAYFQVCNDSDDDDDSGNNEYDSYNDNCMSDQKKGLQKIHSNYNSLQ